MARYLGFLQFSAGSSIGLVVGLIGGLSISPVTSTVLGALSAGLLILLGFKETGAPSQSENHAPRVLGFGVFCSIALICGIWMRTHQTLSSPLDAQKRRLLAIKVFSDAEVDRILLLTNFGIEPIPPIAPGDTNSSPEDQAVPEIDGGISKSMNTVPPSTDRMANQVYGGFLRAGSAIFCQVARREQFHDLHEYLIELKARDPRLAKVIESAPAGDQDRLSKSLSQYLCP